MMKVPVVDGTKYTWDTQIKKPERERETKCHGAKKRVIYVKDMASYCNYHKDQFGAGNH